jgi:hypothetical protein
VEIRKLTYDYVNDYVENKGYKLLFYENTQSKLLVKCDKDHEYNVTWGNFQQGHRCYLCSVPIRSEKRKYTLNEINDLLEKEGYKLLSGYKSYHNKIHVECPNKHEYLTSLCRFLGNKRCPYCSRNAILTTKYVKDIIEENGYTLLSKYIRSQNYLTVKCDKGHKYKVTWNSFNSGNRCPKCSKVKKYSKSEKLIVKYVKEFYTGKVVENDRTQIFNEPTKCYLELDIWLPEIRKAIEFNGMRYHCHDINIKRDIIKKQKCEDQNITLLVIDEYNWLKDKKNVLFNIKSFVLT